MDKKQRFSFGLVSIFLAFLWRKKSGVKSNDFEDIENQVLDKPILKSKYKSGEYRYYDGEHTIMTIKEMKAQCPHYSLPNQNRK